MSIRSGALLRRWKRTGETTLPENTQVYIDPHKAAIARHRAFYDGIPTEQVANLSSSDKKFLQAIKELTATPDTSEPAPVTNEVETILIRAVRTNTPRPSKIPQHVEYRRMDNPLIMLYGAVLMSIHQFDRIPDCLFISSQLIPALERETETATGKRYDGHFRMYYPGAIDGRTKIFPVFTEEALPKFLEGVKIGLDTVVAIAER